MSFGLQRLGSVAPALRELWQPLGRLLVVQRLALSACVLLGVSMTPGVAESRTFSALPTLPLLDPWLRADSIEFLREAHERGSTEVFPLYPELVRLLALLGSLPIAALLLANLSLAVAVFTLHAFATRKAATLAGNSSFALLVFPSAFLFSAGNNLALFLACAIGACAARELRRSGVAALCVFCGVLTHPLGAVVLSLPFVAAWWAERSNPARFPWFVLAVPAGLLSLAALSQLHHADAFRLPKQALGLGSPAMLSEATRALLDRPGVTAELGRGYRAWLDWASMLLLIFAAVRFLRRGQHLLGWYCVFSIAGHFLVFSSATRGFETAALTFPVYLAIAGWCAYDPFERAYRTAAPMLQAACAVLFGAGLWAV